MGADMNNDMLCKHKESKPKLVSLAQKSRYGHEQWFEVKDCCKSCGKEMNRSDDSE